ncbi:MAG: hypothetical protein AMJ38_00060 [Dehalococcoidia bacterium DG_22]|nr:MAG: hypothetical protein AMJ38_00060 [Dehalococcoidia bacterium DG_22]
MLEVLLQFRHRRFRRDLSAYVDNMLSEQARRRLEAHLDSCQACRQELAELRSTVEALGSLPMAEVPRSFTLAAAPVAEVRPRPTARRLEFGLRLATATAAFALALVVIGDFAGLPGDGEEEEEEMPALLAPAAAETPATMEAVPVETPEPLVPGVSDVQRLAEATGVGVSEEEYAEKEAMEGAEVEEEGEVEEEAEAGAAETQAVAEEEGGGVSREEAVRWLEVGLGAGVGILVIVWALARFQRSIGNRP